MEKVRDNAAWNMTQNQNNMIKGEHTFQQAPARLDKEVVAGKWHSISTGIYTRKGKHLGTASSATEADKLCVEHNAALTVGTTAAGEDALQSKGDNSLSTNT